jgi:heme-degrading monooxygenase HmoA
VPLAQLNIARIRFPLDAPQMADFVAQLEAVNAAAESADGFIWRLADDGPGSTSYRLLGDDALIVNMSVWRDLASLRAFVVGHPPHREALHNRRQWFERPTEAMTACWHVEDGHQPSLEEAETMLLRLRSEGPTPTLFPFSYR